MTYKEAYNDILKWLRNQCELIYHDIEEIEADLKDEGVPSRGSARNLIKASAKAEQIEDTIELMEYQVEEEIEDNEQNAAIRFCHDHNLLMIPVDHYHMLNVTYNAYMNNTTYEDAEKMLLEEVKE